MPTYFVKNGGDGTGGTTDPGTSGTWPNALATLGAAITAANTDGDIIKVSDEHVEVLGASASYAPAANIRIICVDHQNTATLSTQDYTNYYIGSTGGIARAISFQPVDKKVFITGLALVVTGNATLSFSGNGNIFNIENCILRSGQTASGGLSLGSGDDNNFIRLANCTHRMQTGTSSALRVASKAEIIGMTVTAEGTLPTNYIASSSADPGGAYALFDGCDLSALNTTLYAANTNNEVDYVFNNCKMHASTIYPNAAGVHATFFNCASGDTHYNFMYYDELGSIVSVPSPYIADGAQFDGTGRVGWKIDTTSLASYYHPFVTPWIETYHAGTTAITPSIEGLMINDATVAKNAEVWGEFSYQGSTNSTLAVFVNDRMAVLGSNADQTSTKTYADWTATPATDTGDSVFKLATTATVTPAEIGMLRGRVCVGEASKTLYIDPQIRT